MEKLEPRLVKLSKFMSLVLRHDPDAANLSLDAEGAVPLDLFLEAVRERFPWASQADLATILADGSKPRFEISDGRIRARWGHSTEARIPYAPAEPPVALYHGTARCVVPVILRDGLKSMTRQYVHLSLDVETARRVGSRHDRQPAILIVQARKAWESGVVFHGPDPSIWLSAAVPPEFISES